MPILPSFLRTRLQSWAAGTLSTDSFKIYRYAAAFVAFSLLIVTLFLEHHNHTRAKVYLETRQQILDMRIRGAADKISLHLQGLHQVLRAFTLAHRNELEQWLSGDQAAQHALETRLRQLFPHFQGGRVFAADLDRPPYFKLRFCTRQFMQPPADRHTVRICMQAQSAQARIRLAGRWLGHDDQLRALVVSLDMKTLSPHLQTAGSRWGERDDKDLLLINLAENQFIDLSSNPRRYPPGSPVDSESHAYTLFTRPVPDTTWQVAGIAPAGAYTGYAWSLWRNTLIMIVPLIISSVILLIFIRQESTRRNQSEAALRRHAEQLGIIVDNLPHAVFLKDGEGRWLQANPFALKLFGLEDQPYHGETEVDLAPHCGIAGDALLACQDSDAKAWQQGKPYHAEEQVPGPDGTRYFDVLKIPRFDAGGERQQLIVVATDITARKHGEQILYEEKERVLVTLAAITDAVITTTAEGNIAYMNPVAEKLTGWPLYEALNQPVTDIAPLFNENTEESVLHPVQLCVTLCSVMRPTGNIALRQRSGRMHPVEETAAPLCDPNGMASGAVLILHDISTTRHLSQQLNYQASHDLLTGLLNRHEFEQRVTAALQDNDTSYVLSYLDLDQFKVLNDTCGHLAGDALLRQLAVLLQQHLDAKDTLARLGGDEFGILFADCRVVEAQKTLESIREEIYHFRFMWEGKLYRLSTSAGMAELKPDSDYAEILRAADSACYTAKDLGRNRLHVYSPDDSKTTLRHAEMEWVTAIHSSFAEDRFQLFRQRIIPLDGSHPEQDGHFEILLRMRDPQGALVAPGSFIAAAERYGLMNAIDRWVVRNCFAALAANPPLLADLNLCSINLSGQTLSDDEFLEFVTEQFETYPIPPEKICFEITETAAVTEMREALEFITQLKALGCRFALDDFGSGFSSFGYLKKLPVDYLKIDGSFVKDMVDDPIDAEMVKAINQLGQVMGLQTIAEFVENDAIIEKLRAYGVDYAQGYAVGMPTALEVGSGL